MTGYGVTRLVTINSGGYAFADVGLSSPIHLVAPNNRGKSTLVNALQFLYIDDFRHMQFPKAADETKQHYFGEDTSYLIFECATLTGPQSLLVVGQGRLKGSGFTRYVFSGGFQPEDFADASNRVVKFDVLRKTLAGRNLVEVKPTEFWEVLCMPNRRARPQQNGHLTAHLGLLPIRSREDYRAFRETYVRLLSLSDANALELRQLLISCHASQVGEVRLDVAAEYSDQFDTAERTDNRLAFLRCIGAQIEMGDGLRREIVALRETLSDAIPSCLAAACRCKSAATAFAAQQRNMQTVLGDQQKQLAAERLGAAKQLWEHERQQQELQNRLAAIDLLHSKWRSSTAEMVQAMRDNADSLRDRIALLRQHLTQANSLDVRALTRSTRELAADIKRHNQSLEKWEQRLCGWLHDHGIESSSLSDAFRVINPKLLDLIVGDEVSIQKPAAVEKLVSDIAARVQANVYEDEIMHMALSNITGPTPEQMMDPELLKHTVRFLQTRLVDESKRLAVAEDVSAAETNLKALDCDHQTATLRLREYEQYRSQWETRGSLVQQLSKATDDVAAATAHVAALEATEAALAERHAVLASTLSAVDLLLSSLDASRTTTEAVLQSADLSCDVSVTDDEPCDVADLPALRTIVDNSIAAMHALNEKVRSSKRAEDRLKLIEREIMAHSEEYPGQRMYFSDANEDWTDLIDGYSALPEMERTSTQNWETLFTTIRAKLDGLVQGSRAIGNAAARLNAAMGKHQVSNLRAVQLCVDRKHDACDLLESLTRPDGLFTDQEALVRAKDQMRRWIKAREVIKLDDLFAVKIRVQSMDGNWVEAQSLDDIGSTGTRTTAKAMIFIQLVRATVGDERYNLHFYLDETGQLDDHNLNAIAKMASERGIVAITAEPRVRIEPLTHPKVTVVALGCTPEGRFYVDSQRTIMATRRKSESQSIRHVAEPA